MIEIHVHGPIAITVADEQTPGRVQQLLERFEEHLNKKVGQLMAAIDDANANLAALVAEDGIVIKGLDDLLAQGQANAGNVPVAAVQALSDGIKAEVGKLAAAVQADDPSVVPAPDPTPAPAPAPAPVDPTPAPAPDPTPAPVVDPNAPTS